MTEYQPKRTSAPPRVIDGVTFLCWRLGICRYVWRSEDGRIAADRIGDCSTYWASVDGTRLGKRFRSLENAMRAGVALAGKPRAIPADQFDRKVRT